VTVVASQSPPGETDLTSPDSFENFSENAFPSHRYQVRDFGIFNDHYI